MSLFAVKAFHAIPFAVVLSACLLFSAGRRLELKVAPTNMKTEFEKEIRRRGIEKNFAEYQKYVETRIDQTRGTDRFRLPWIESLVRRPLDASHKAEEFTARLYGLSAGKDPLISILEELSIKLDVKKPEDQKPESEPIAGDPLTFLTGKLHDARGAMNRAFRMLTTPEKEELREKIYSNTTIEGKLGYRFGGEDHGARALELMRRVDLREIANAATHLSAITEPAFLEQLQKFYRQRSNRAVLREVKTDDGIILIGGDGPNIYDLDQSAQVYAVIDFGGDDIYEEGSTSEERPVFAILDLNGNDVYRGRNPGIQGGSILGASLLLDRSGNDRYESTNVAQGSSLTGVGILIDEKGDDRYIGDVRVQGQAIGGFGILLDRSGHDRYRGALFAQGAGGPLGAGLLIDSTGEDEYFAGGKYADSYDDSPGFGAWSQGIGVGARDGANGGIGVLLDGSGDDSYEADYFSHGGGYWFGAGFVRDFQGNDMRWGAVRTNFDGTSRKEERYLRWGMGFGCHFAAGFVFDDQGHDSYNANWASIAFGWDLGTGVVFDGDGNDRYVSQGAGVAESRNAGFAILFDIRGKDTYLGYGLGSAQKTNNQLSFAFLFDRSGRDTFHQPIKRSNQRAWSGGIFIDR